MSANILEREKFLKSWEVIKSPVKNIFYKGNIDLLTGNYSRLAVVGTRRMTDYGGRVIEKWMSKIVDANVVIVSGFMYGVDQKAHWECINNGGKTIAVLGWGIDWKVMDSDVEIYQKILESGGLILSEYEGDARPELWKFPQRNRIVAGISDAVFVVEGAIKSGSMITAKLTKQFDKKLLALPGPVTSKVAEGTNNLIKTGDAKMVTSADDILREMNLGLGQLALVGRSQMSPPRADLHHRTDEPMAQALAEDVRYRDTILEILENEPKSADELARILRQPVHEVLTKLSNLSLRGLVEEKNGKYFLL
jgi:DNA processing protein